MGKNIFELIEDGKVSKSTSVDIFDFAPIVYVNDRKSGDNIIYAPKECIEVKSEKLTLSSSFDKKKRDYLVSDVSIAKNSISKIPLKIIQGYDPFGPNDNDGIVSFSCSNSKVKITPVSTKVNYGDEIEIEIEHTLSRGEKFSIDIEGKDDKDDTFGVSDLVVTSGKINFSIVDKDVFLKSEHQKMVDEIIFLKPFADAGAPSEYSGNYCMSAAERALSILTQNTTNFYSVDRTHNRLNNIGFSGKGAKDRGAKFKSLGYTKSNFIFDGYNIDHNKRVATKNNSDYSSNKYDVVTITKGSPLFTYFTNDINKKIGYHVYYMSITNDFHTLILIINNIDPCNKTYSIYDQHGKTSSSGKFLDIEDGIAKQTSWTFLNDYMNRGFIPSKYGKATTRLWKIQRKS